MCLRKIKHVLKNSKEQTDDTMILEKYREIREDAELCLTRAFKGNTVGKLAGGKTRVRDEFHFLGYSHLGCWFVQQQSFPSRWRARLAAGHWGLIINGT